MTPRHPARAAFGAGLVLLAAVAVFGNQWFADHVVSDARSDRARAILRIPASFQWRFTRLGDLTTLWIAGLLGAIAVVVVVYVAVWAVATRATGLSLLLGTWGVTVLAAMAAGWLETVIAYGDFFQGTSDPQRLGRFWYSVFNGAEPAALFGAAAGLVAGLVAMLFAGAAEGATNTTSRGVYVAGAPAYAPVGAYVPVAAAPAEGYDPTTQYQSQYSTPAQDQTGQYPYTSENESTPPPPPYDPDKTTVIPSAAEWTSPPPPPPPPWVAPEDRTTRD
jgi:hypothetical protein